jgi:hypothetical protein
MSGYRRRGIAAAVTAVVALAALLHERRDPLLLAIAWSAAILVSFVGWGSLVNLWLARDRWADWGLRAGWGMAVSILSGGYLCLVHAVRPAVLVAQVAIGAALFFASWVWRPWRRVSVRRVAVVAAKPGVLFVLAVGYLLAGLLLVASLSDHGFQPSDDYPFYFVLAEKLAHASSTLQPFMARRVSTFGGHVYLMASFLSVASPYFLSAVDCGISVILVYGLLAGQVAGARLKPWHAAPLGLATLLLFALVSVRVNAASLYSGVVGVVTLYRTVRFGDPPGVDRAAPPAWPMPPRRLIAVAALAVVCILLRTSNAAAVLPFCFLLLASDFVLTAPRPYDRETVRSIARVALTFGGALLVALLPWSLMMRGSCGTFFYPLGSNNLTAGWTFLKPASSWAEEARLFVELTFHESPISVVIPFFLPGLLPMVGRRRNDLAILTLSSVIGVLALAREATAFGPDDTVRYLFGFVAATALLVAACSERYGPRMALAGMAVGVHFAAKHDSIRGRLEDQVQSAKRALNETPADVAAFDAATADYRELQDHVPEGSVLVSAVHQPWRFDFARNEIFTLDVLGGMGPKPGFPVYKGPSALGEYLLANGVRYLAWVDWDLPSEFYNRSHWQQHLARTDYLQSEARIQLDAMDTIEKLGSEHRTLFRGHGMTLVDLAAPREGP